MCDFCEIWAVWRLHAHSKLPSIQIRQVLGRLESADNFSTVVVVRSLYWARSRLQPSTFRTLFRLASKAFPHDPCRHLDAKHGRVNSGHRDAREREDGARLAPQLLVFVSSHHETLHKLGSVRQGLHCFQLCLVCRVCAASSTGLLALGNSKHSLRRNTKVNRPSPAALFDSKTAQLL